MQAPERLRALGEERFERAGRFRAFPLDEQKKLLPATDGSLYASYMAYWNARPGTPALSRMLYADQKTYLVELLMKQDQMSMAASIESRVPFLDHKLLEFAARIPARHKVRYLSGKYLLRRAMEKRLPAEILNRTKMGFPTPVGRWLGGPFWPLVEELVLSPRALGRGWFQPEAVRQLAEEHRRGLRAHGDRLWLLLNLEIWQRVFLEGEDADAMVRAA